MLIDVHAGRDHGTSTIAAAVEARPYIVGLSLAAATPGPSEAEVAR